MKRYLLIILLALCAIHLEAQKTIYTVEIFNGYGNPNTTVSVTLDSGGLYNIGMTTGTFSPGTVCIGSSRKEALGTLKRMRRFLEDDNTDFVMLHVNEYNTYLKLVKPDGGDGQWGRYTDMTPVAFVTDGSEAWSEIPMKLVKKSVRKIRMGWIR